MKIESLESQHVEPLRDLYNDVVVPLAPHCYPVEADRFRSAFAPVLGEGKGLEKLTDEQVLVALIDGEPAGYIHIADHTEGSAGATRHLLFRQGERSVGQALLDDALGKMSRHEFVHAYHQYYRYEFYSRSCTYLSDRIGHVQALHQVNGFERNNGEIHFDWDHYDVEPGDPPLDVEVMKKIGDETDRLPDQRSGLKLGEDEIAVCELCSCGKWTNEPSVQDRLFVTWLGVEEAYQGKKLGQYALLYAMKEAKTLGYRNAAISTAVPNHRAFVFYSNIGFHVTDMTYKWTRRMTTPRRSSS